MPKYKFSNNLDFIFTYDAPTYDIALAMLKKELEALGYTVTHGQFNSKLDVTVFKGGKFVSVLSCQRFSKPRFGWRFVEFKVIWNCFYIGGYYNVETGNLYLAPFFCCVFKFERYVRR